MVCAVGFRVGLLHAPPQMCRKVRRCAAVQR